MSKRISNTVQSEIGQFYARLATAAAKKAVWHVKENNFTFAGAWAKQTEDWLIKAGAEATRWVFRLPEV